MDRRTFLKLLIGGMSIPLLEANGEDGKEAAQRKQDENNVVILSDVHVGVRSGQWQRDHLAGRVSTILSMKPLPCCVLILGDLAYDHGDVGDYTLFKRMMEPLDKAGVPWHPMMGNHDDREAFFSVFPERRSRLVSGRLVTVVKTRYLDFVLLDSLKDGKIGGEIDIRQKAWLQSFLSSHRKPVFVCAHHPLYETKLQVLLEKSPCVAGYLHGHLHRWQESWTKKGMPKISAPSGGQWGDIGYLVLRQRSNRARISLTMLDHFYPMPQEPPKAEWLEAIRKKNGSEVVVPLGIA